VAGVPGSIVKYRFSKEIVEKLLSLDYSKLNKEKILKNVEYWYEPVTQKNIDELIEKIKK
jgi:hypothetical protein